jgi:enoyl-CoA hydratase/carnithine racemase
MRPRRIPYAGKPTIVSYPTIANGASLGPRGIAFLRRVALSPQPYRMALNADRMSVDRAVASGFVRRDVRDDQSVWIVGKGREFLDRLMRCE